MSSISSADAENFRYFTRALKDLERTQQEELDRKEQAHQDELDGIEKSRAKERDGLQKEADETVLNQKRASQEQIEDERKKAKSEISELKKTLYGRSGRAQSEADDLRVQMQEAEKSFARREEKQDRNLDNTTRFYQEMLSDVNQQNGRKIEEILEEQKTETQQKLDSMKDEERGLIKGMQEKHATEQYETIDRGLDALQSKDREMQKAIAELGRVNDRRIDSLTKHVEAQSDKRSKEHASELERAVEDTRNSHAKEAEVLRSKLKQYLENSKDFEKGYADGRVEAVGEHEAAWNARNKNQQFAYEQQIDNLKHQLRTSEDHF